MKLICNLRVLILFCSSAFHLCICIFVCLCFFCSSFRHSFPFKFVRFVSIHTHTHNNKFELLNDSQRAAQIETVTANDKQYILYRKKNETWKCLGIETQPKTKEHQFGLHVYLNDMYCVVVMGGGGVMVLFQSASKHTRTVSTLYWNCMDGAGAFGMVFSI